MGTIEIPSEHYWEAQAERSVHSFPIGRDTFVWSRPMIHTLGMLKKSVTLTNKKLSELPDDMADLIIAAADEIITGERDAEFPLVVFQTGPDTQSNMNANEVIADLAIERAGDELGSKTPVHPSDHINRGQSSNDTFPIAIHIAVVSELNQILFPAVGELRGVLKEKSAAFTNVIKVGHTHLQDVTPITVDQEMSGWAAQLDFALEGIHFAGQQARDLAIGGTAVDTGLNAHPEFDKLYAKKISGEIGLEFKQTDNLFASLSTHDALVQVSGSLRVLADTLMKIVDDVRWETSGPRNGIGELLIPEDEPGSSIMPGKVNPAQYEVMTMMCVKVFSSDTTVGLADSQGNFQLNVFKPVMVWRVLESIRLLSDTCRAFTEHCARGLELNYQKVETNLNSNLMQIVALNRHIGCNKAAKVTEDAYHQGVSLRGSALESGFLTAEEFNKWVVPLDMAHPSAG